MRNMVKSPTAKLSQRLSRSQHQVWRRSGDMKLALIAFCFTFNQSPVLHAQTGNSDIDLTILDRATRKPIPCRVYLKNSEGRTMLAPGLPKWRDHFVCSGKVQMDLPAGNYSYEVERGPEYLRTDGSFTIADDGH